MKYNILITSGKKIDIKSKYIFDAHLWIHNGVIEKNHIPDKDFEQISKSYKHEG